MWQTVLVTLLYLYVARNFGKLVGLECPEPLASLYSRSYFRATWVTTALDAGFWSAMKIKRKALRDILSIVFSVYYLICAEQADEKVRKIRATLTVDHLRVAWNKGTTPYLSALTTLMRPRLMWYVAVSGMRTITSIATWLRWTSGSPIPGRFFEDLTRAMIL